MTGDEKRGSGRKVPFRFRRGTIPRSADPEGRDRALAAIERSRLEHRVDRDEVPDDET